MKASNLSGFVDLIKNRFPEYLNSVGWEVRGEMIKCPNHIAHSNNDQTISASIGGHNSGFLFNCFVCGASGTIIDFVYHTHNLPTNGYGFYQSTISHIAEQLDILSDFEAVMREENSSQRLKYKMMEEIVSMLKNSSTDNKVVSFMEQRGYAKEVIPRITEEYMIGLLIPKNVTDTLNKIYSESDIDIKRAKKEFTEHIFLTSEKYDDHKHLSILSNTQIVIGLTQYKTQLIGLAVRKNDSKEGEKKGSKYINSKTWEPYTKNKYLYGLDIARSQIQKTQEVYVVEGYFDVIAMHLAGYMNTVAVCGNTLTNNGVMLLKDIGIRKIIMCLDGDAGGNIGLQQTLKNFRNMDSTQIFIKELPNNHDAESFILIEGKEAFDKIEIKDIISVFIRKELSEVGNIDYAIAMENILKLLSRYTKSAILHTIYANVIIDTIQDNEQLHLNIGYEEIFQSLQQEQRKLDIPYYDDISLEMSSLQNWEYGTSDVSEIVKHLEDTLESVKHIHEKIDPTSEDNGDLAVLRRANEALENIDSLKMCNHWKEFENGMPFYTTGGLILIAADPHVGKSALKHDLFMTIIENNNDVYCIDVALDDGDIDAFMRYQAWHARVPMGKAKYRKNLTANEKDKLNLSYQYLETVVGKKLGVKADIKDLRDLEMVVRKERTRRPNTNIIVFIDAINDLKDARASESIMHSMETVIDGLSTIQKKYMVNLICVTHLTKSNDTSRPRKSRLKGTASLEFNAKGIVMLYNERTVKYDNEDGQSNLVWFDDEGGEQPILELNFAKNKLGDLSGTTFKKMNAKTGRIYPVTQQETEKYKELMYNKGTRKNTNNYMDGN